MMATEISSAPQYRFAVRSTSGGGVYLASGLTLADAMQAGAAIARRIGRGEFWTVSSHESGTVAHKRRGEAWVIY